MVGHFNERQIKAVTNKTTLKKCKILKTPNEIIINNHLLLKLNDPYTNKLELKLR